MAVPHQRFGDPICSSEMGTRVFAIINLIITSGLSIYGTVLMVYLPQMLADAKSGINSDSSPHDRKLAFNMLILVMLELAAVFMAYISLVFAALLGYGFFKKRSGYLKAYLCYGLFVEIISAIAIVVAFIPEANGSFVIPVSASGGAIALLAIYSLILVMIRITYNKFVNLQVQNGPEAVKIPEEAQHILMKQ